MHAVTGHVLVAAISAFPALPCSPAVKGRASVPVDVAQTARLLVSDALTAVRAPVLSRRFQRSVAAAIAGPGPVQVNVGAGTVVLPGWINTDVLWRGDMYLDLTRPWPVPEQSVDRIYADNVIEHFPLPVGRDVLRNCLRALRPGGGIRLATPDLERTARAYLENAELTSAHLDRHRRHGYPAEHPADMLRVTYAYHGHHEGYIYDFASLSAELTAAGFVNVRRYDAGRSDDAAFGGLETRAEPTEAATELIVEAWKAAR
jgi:predicted SAM-dependent methyltransferase